MPKEKKTGEGVKKVVELISDSVRCRSKTISDLCKTILDADREYSELIVEAVEELAEMTKMQEKIIGGYRKLTNKDDLVTFLKKREKEIGEREDGFKQVYG